MDIMLHTTNQRNRMILFVICLGLFLKSGKMQFEIRANGNALQVISLAKDGLQIGPDGASSYIFPITKGGSGKVLGVDQTTSVFGWVDKTMCI